MHRNLRNPILTRHNILSSLPELRDVSSVFNPGVIHRDGTTQMLLRVQNRGRETLLLPAESSDGINFDIAAMPSVLKGLTRAGETIFHAYDPRLTEIERELFVTLSLDTDTGSRAVLMRTEDLTCLDYVGTLWEGDARNGVLFPEKVGGRYLALVRPNETRPDSSVPSGASIWLVESEDLKRWKPVKEVMRGRPRYWDELIGSGPPPVKTEDGWLHIYHGIATHFDSVNVYQAGVCLLDLLDPTKLIARGQYNILEPRTDYELSGQVPNVVFPTAMIVDQMSGDGIALPSSKVTIYYGAADTVVAAATTTIGELVKACYD